MSTPMLWQRFLQHLCRVPALGLALDVSRMRFEDGFLDRMAPPMQRAFEAMDALERGSIANPDENRLVGHYWLRAPDQARAGGVGGPGQMTYCKP
jgi:glucose-6-phosphate isomerase